MKIANAVLLLLLTPLSSSTAEVSLKILRVGVVVCALLSAFAEDLTLTTWPHGVDLREDPGAIGTPPHQRPGSCHPPPLERVGVRLSSPLHPSPSDLGQRLSLSAEDDDRLRALSTQSLYLLPTTTNTNTSFSFSLSLSFNPAAILPPCPYRHMRQRQSWRRRLRRWNVLLPVWLVRNLCRTLQRWWWWGWQPSQPKHRQPR